MNPSKNPETRKRIERRLQRGGYAAAGLGMAGAMQAGMYNEWDALDNADSESLKNELLSIPWVRILHEHDSLKFSGVENPPYIFTGSNKGMLYDCWLSLTNNGILNTDFNTFCTQFIYKNSEISKTEAQKIRNRACDYGRPRRFLLMIEQKTGGFKS
jgi:hypothetical protein